MPRNAQGQYSKPANTVAIPNEVILASKYNTAMDDLVADANAVRPVAYGGTGVSSLEALSEALQAMVFLGTGAELPTEDVGPLFHADYGFETPLVWQVFDANGAAFAGYASANVGRSILEDNQPRTGWVADEGGSISKTGIGRALWHWALHNDLVVPLADWQTKRIVFADLGDGNFRLPDQRDVFWRGRGGSRVVGDYQGDELGTHDHSMSTNGSHSHSGSTSTDTHNHLFAADRGFSDGTGTGYGTGSKSERTDSDSHSHSLNINSSGNHTHTINAAGGSETRPVNVAKQVVRKL